jgi:AcrR family transcriptional regulator
MARTPGNADRLLLTAAKEIAKQQGCSGLRIRDVADRAGVNLGMFHYHFRNKKRFTRALMQELSEASRDGEKGIVQLRNSLLAVGLFNRDNRQLLASLFKDILNEDQEVVHFIRQNAPRHVAVVRELIEKCQREGSIAKLPLPQVMSFIMSGLNFPNIVASIVEQAGIGSRTWIKAQMQTVTSDAAIAQRVDLVLKGLRS